MASIGQAQANADLVAELLALSPPREGGSIWFAGAGTGQMFDFLDPGLLRPYRTAFTDINAAFLERLTARLRGTGLAFETRVDDLECPSLAGCFDLVVAVLVLEHVDWRRAVTGMCALSAGRVFVVIQENPPDCVQRPAVGTMQVLREIGAHDMDREALVREFEERGYGLRRVAIREVADAKKMVGLEFLKAGHCAVP
jgi:hypothetical protein